MKPGALNTEDVMKKHVYGLFTLLLLLSFVSIAGAAAQPWQVVVDKIEAGNAEAAGRAKLVEQLIREDRATLQAVLKNYRRQIAETENRLQPLMREYEHLEKLEKAQQAALAKEREEIENIQGTVFGFAKQSTDLFEISSLGEELKQQRAAVEAIATRKTFPGMSEIKTLVTLFRKYREQATDIRTYEGTFVGSDGRPAKGKIMRIGGLTAIYTQNGEQGYLVPTDNGHELSAVAGSIPGRVRASIGDFIEGRRNSLPLDISGGAAFLKLTKDKSLFDTLKSGGLLVWPILAVGLLALLLAAEKGVFLFRIRSNSDRIMDDISRMVENDEIDNCTDYCRNNSRYPTCQIMASGLRHIGQTQQVLENALHEALLQQIPRFERFLPTLAMLAGISPLLGLLGTVTGMISTFQVINLFGTGDPRMMSGGISEALITTQLGLVVAIPILFTHHFFERKVDIILTDMEEKAPPSWCRCSKTVMSKVRKRAMNGSLYRQTCDFFLNGGAVMPPLLIISLIMWFLILFKSHQFLTARREECTADDGWEALKKQRADGSVWQRRMLDNFRVLQGKGGTVEFSHLSRMQNKQESDIDRYIASILVLAGSAPLLGLLGTVSGMITTFDVISMFGTGNARAMASGISEALISTQAGLVVAIPGLVLGSLLSRRADNLKERLRAFSIGLVLCSRKE
jgi:biopolymer transport protein ExbB